MAPRGRKPVPKAPTKFLNSKRRVIYMTAEGKYLAKSDKGATVYNPKAKYVKSPGGTERVLTNSQARVPTAIRPKMMRKVRSNAGKKRGPRAGVKAGMLPALFATPKKMASPMWNLPNPMGMGMRKVRKNKGTKRGPRGLGLLARTAARM
jgi:hypothetical protein